MAARNRSACGASPSAQAALEKLYEAMSEVHNAIADRLGTSRPDIDISRTMLEPLQAPAPVATIPKNLRVCFYCFGFFQKQAFELDHIRPVNRPIHSSCDNTPEDINRYNDPTNLIAVCSSCNSSKSNSTIRAAWMNGRMQAREAGGLPGLETLLTAPSDRQAAEAHRNWIMGA
ncbi:MAG: HNH endonuclease [Gammaproteobacteria bacterium]|nr:HNH endonuclease [Gammaproteobacteria bacterium]